MCIATRERVTGDRRRLAFAFDLDGVIYAGEQLLSGAAEAVAEARNRGHSAYFLTNNSRQNSFELAAKLQRMGVGASPRDVISATEVAGLVVSRLRPRPRSVMVIGSDSLAIEIGRAGVEVLRGDDGAAAGAVVFGLDQEVSYEKLLAAHRAIAHFGAAFFAVNLDRTYASQGGTVPGCGAFAASVASSTGKRARLIGKPAPHMFRRILELEEASPDKLVVFGDSLDADVAGAKSAGARSVLVLTGVDSRAAAERASPRRRPDWIIEDLRSVPFDEIERA